MKTVLTLAIVLVTQLTVIGQANQRFTSFEEAFKDPEKVKWLDLVCEDIPRITEQINQLPNLESLYFKGCDLKQLPEGVEKCRRGRFKNSEN